MKNYQDLVKEAVEMIANDDELMVDLVNELDSLDGYADGFRAFPMCELNDICCGMKLDEFLDVLTSDFNKNDNYFYFSIYGLESCDNIAELYKANTDPGEVFDHVLANHHNLWIDNAEFEDLLNAIEEARN